MRYDYSSYVYKRNLNNQYQNEFEEAEMCYELNKKQQEEENESTKAK